jgi:hypothetical protein
MPGVTCANCGTGTNVSFRRGTRLADLGCPNCGKTELRLRSAGQASKNKGRTYERCIIDGKRSLSHLHPAFEWTPKYSLAAEAHPAGEPCCWSHEPVPVTRTRSEVVLNSLVVILGPRGLGGRRDPDPAWATDEQLATMEAMADIPETCPICVSVGWTDGRFEVSWPAFKHGIALIGHCWRCGHTIELIRISSDGGAR